MHGTAENHMMRRMLPPKRFTGIVLTSLRCGANDTHVVLIVHAEKAPYAFIGGRNQWSTLPKKR